MGRIDEALRRARTPLPNIESRQPGVVFVSVWPDPEAPIERPARPPESKRSRSVELAPAPASIWPVPLSPIDSVDPEWREKLALSASHEGVIRQFRRLAAILVQAQRSRPLKTIMITSAVPGDGKTLTALNLALILSESYRRRVVLIEADFRRPRIGSVINLPVADGLSDVMKSAEDQKVRRVQLTPNLTLLPAGRPDPDPVSGLTSPRMQELLLAAAEGFDWVILDTPPTSVAADAGLLGALADATILVVRAGHTLNADVQRAIEAIGRERIIGVVLNGADTRSAMAGDYAYGSLADGSNPSSDLV